MAPDRHPSIHSSPILAIHSEASREPAATHSTFLRFQRHRLPISVVATMVVSSIQQAAGRPATRQETSARREVASSSLGTIHTGGRLASTLVSISYRVS